jgi:hypothetical protein
MALPEGLSGGGIDAEVAPPAFFPEEGRSHQQFSQVEPHVQVVQPFQHRYGPGTEPG